MKSDVPIYKLIEIDLPIIDINDVEDSRLERYRDLPSARRSRQNDHFIAEGKLVVERLLQSSYEVESLLIVNRRFAELKALIPNGVDVFLLEQSLCEQLVGFQFHSGILGCGIRQRRPKMDLTLPGGPDTPLLLCAFPATTLDINLGSMVRTSAAFGVNGLIVGPKSADPFSRRSLRSSMGNVFSIPVVQPQDLRQELERLESQFGFEMVAVHQSDNSIGLDQFEFPNRTVLIFGNEGDGLSDEWLSFCSASIEIPIAPGVDSLNVAAAATVLLYEHFRRSRIK